MSYSTREAVSVWRTNRIRYAKWFGIGLMSLAGCSDPGGAEGPPIGKAKSALFAEQLAPQQYLLTLDVPDSLSAEDVVLEAKGDLDVELLANVQGGVVANIGTHSTRIGPSAHVGPTLSVAPLTLFSGTVVDGDVKTSANLTRWPGVTVAGSVETKVELPVKNEVLVTVDVPGGGQGNVFVGFNQTVTLTPNAYASLHVGPRGKARLSAGDYYFGTLDIAVDGVLEIDTGAGIVTATVLHDLDLWGSVEHVRPAAQSAQDFVMLALTDQTVTVTGTFVGTLVAPNAKLSLFPGKKDHQGSFFARDLEAEGGVRIVHQPFHWDVFRGKRRTVTLQALDAPVSLMARIFPNAFSEQATYDAPSPVSVVIPSRLEVEAGNAGNGRAELRIDAMTCQYRGGAATTPATTDLDHAKGKFFKLVSCTNGGAAGKSVSAKHFELKLLDPNPEGRVAVHLALGDGCSPSIGYPMDPEESVTLRDSFNWAATKPLPELDRKGRPNLYYFNVYIESVEQLRLLESLQVPFEYMPLLRPERARFSDKCGSVNMDGDGRGIFVYAIIPASIYNRVRLAALDPSVPPNDPTRWKALVRRTIPAQVANLDGSFSYEALRQAGFEYKPRSEKHPRREKSGTLPLFGDLFEGIVDIANDVRDAVGEGLSGIDKLISGSVNLDVKFEIMDRSGAFPPGVPLRRGWGSSTGQNLVPDGVDLEINYGVLGIPQIEAKLREDGTARFSVPDGANLEDICVVLANDAARIKGFIDVHSVCDFRIAQEIENSESFEHSDQFRYVTNNWMLHLHAQLTDGYHYVRRVVGFDPFQANVTAGGWANNLSVKDGGELRIFTPCLDFPDVPTAALTVLFLPSAVAIDIISETDIVFPGDSPSSKNSRVPTHEYGHYTVCSLRYHSDPVHGVSNLITNTIADGDDLDPDDDDTRILNEAFADFFAMQVAGATNYFKPGINFGDFVTEAGGSMSYCARPNVQTLDPRHYCIEDNLSRAEMNGRAPGNQEIGVWTSVFQDAFDGNRDSNTADVPTSAMMNRIDPGGLLTVQPWFEKRDDEGVKLSGKRMVEWFDNSNEVGNSFSKVPFLSGLSMAAYDAGHTWCEVCRMFAIHTDLVAKSLRDGSSSSLPGSMMPYFQACVQSPIALYVGPPPTDDFNRLNTSCVVCDPGSIAAGNECAPILQVHPPPCEPWEIFTEFLGEQVCAPCREQDDIAWEGQCHDCPASAPIWSDITEECVRSCSEALVQDGRVCQKFR
jgi:hypothetical protein